jgi:phosphoglycerol transferase MdoB-like AlkP superfamily enzyme
MDLRVIITRRPLVIIRSTLLSGFLLLLLMAAVRLCSVYWLNSDAWGAISGEEKINFLIMSLRFDLKFAAIILSPFILLGLLIPYGRFGSVFPKWGAVYVGLVFFATSIAGVSNYYYIQTYGHHFDLMCFGVVNEDFTAVIKSIWDGYPVICFILFSLFCGISAGGLAFAFMWLMCRIGRMQFLWTSVIVMTAFIGVWALLIRGDVGKFPLRRAATAVTTSAAINDLVPSGLMAFAWTVSDYMKEKEIRQADPADLKDAAAYFGLEYSDDYRKVLAVKSRGLFANRPHVILAVMESMSTDMLEADDPATFDIYGSLRKVLSIPTVYSFRNFLSEGDGTIDSIGRILVRQGDNMNHSVGRFSRTGFFTSAAVPFKEHGYHTVLVTAGGRGWRNIGEFAEANGFETVIDDSYILQRRPDAGKSTWGLFDGEMFDFAYDMLKESDRPVFMVLVSVTNHPPYTLPDGYRITGFNVPNQKVEQKYHNEDIYKMYETFRYANDQLGNFILKITGNGELSDRVILAATGDHNVRGLNVYQKISSVVMGHQVPLIVYLPHRLDADLHRYASHKDIMPTLFDLALENAEFYYQGCSLFRSADECPYNFAYNSSVTVTDTGVCIYDSGISRSFGRDDFSGTAPEDNDSCSTAEQFRKLNEWYYRYQTAGEKNGKKK